MKTTSLFGLLLFALSGIIAQPVITRETTIDIQKSTKFSKSRLEKIDQMLLDAIAKGEIPGAVALISKDGKIVFHKAFGTANETGRPLKKDDIFRIASQTKAITATAIMILWEEGKFRLDDPISKYIPEFSSPEILQTFNEADSSFTSIPADHPITIRHLLTHTSGIGYGVIDGDARIRKIYSKAGVVDLFTSSNIRIEQNVKKLAKLPLHHQSGEKFTYGEGLDVLGYLIEIISGKPLDVFFKERIFKPLGMKDTGFYFPENKTGRLVAIQHKKNGNWVNYPSTFYDPDYPLMGAKRFFSGGAGLSGSPEDYFRFLQMYLNGGILDGQRILSYSTVNTIMQDQTGELWGGNEKYYGLAFGVLTRGGEAKGGEGSAGTFDWGGYFNTQYFADPNENIVGILMKQTQGTTNDQTAWKFRQMVFASLED